jgi:glutamine amidotransferase
VKLAIVDLGCGNIGSVAMAFERFGLKPVITGDPDEIAIADRVILPGVGAAGFAMDRIRSLGLRESLMGLRQPALGICLGMQLLFEHSEEEGIDCLGILSGRVRRLAAAPGRPVPHMGWSRLAVKAGGGGGLRDGPFSIAFTDYGGTIPSAVRRDNWLGAQFHPERSGEAGRRFLESFLDMQC